LRLEAGVTCRFISLRRLIAAEPVREIFVDAGYAWRGSAVAFRTLPPFPRPVRVTVGSTSVANDAFLAALLSAPVFASATELVLDGIRRPALVNWLAKSPFLGAVRSLSLARNSFECADAVALARLSNLRNVRHLNVTDNRIGDAGRAALAARFGEGLVV
jgi:hypothetical protein